MTEPVTRDLVDRTELRRRFLAEGWNPASQLMSMLDAMPSVECPRGWTRDEVLHELDTHPGAVCEFQHPCTAIWVDLARGYVEAWHPEVRRVGRRDPLGPDRARMELRDALARTERSGAHAPR